MYGKRVHIVPVGDDVDRMVGPAIELRSDIVYLLAHAPAATADTPSLPAVDWDDSDSVARLIERLEAHDCETVAHAVERLAAHEIDAPVEFVDQNDVYAVLGLTTTLAHRRPEDDDIAVNVSTGTRLATVGAALARMDEDTDADAYHVPESSDGQAVAPADGGVADIPDYHLESPSRDELAAMAIVYTAKKSDLIDWALRLRTGAEVTIGYADHIVRGELDRQRGEPTRFDELAAASKKGAYRTLRTRALEELVECDYVAVDDDQIGRADLVTLTPTGEATLRAFRHKILDVVGALETHAEIPDPPQWLGTGRYQGQ